MIDVHAHWFPPALTKEFDRVAGKKVWPEHSPELIPRVEELEADGVNLQVLGLGHNQPYFEDASKSLHCAKFANDLYAEAADFDGRLEAFGAIPLPHTEQAIAAAVRCLDELHFAGIGLGTTAVGTSLDDPAYEELWAELNRRRAVIFVHPVGTPDTFSTGLDAFMMGPKYGGPMEATLATTHLVVSGVTQRYPDIRWIIGTMGGSIGYLWRRFEEITESVHQDQWLENNPRQELKKLYYDTTLTDDPAAIKFFADSFGADRLVLGTDAPRVRAGDWANRIKAVPGFDEQQLRGVLNDTAASLGIGK
ncbi:amidohydrolase family protein [Amycolatopsis sp. NPDC047767]|uniref:amidohydrolase family protein n=1 Tax=Amycolatopsis sp. NPDC047767 TaxID=3156765 RepID=UPI003454282A